ncbi:hypothetical protein DEO72_LG2g3489 [Vigna unguiculata]|uniref:Uncharacterized protein n=1 Tax=Vigna unguiculata TaxID=3917 RepID=A0A4D6L3S9_VIGUN|nr:hypothetical protein DEO72_LG2g3489 [Vigna unguiculata]
MATPCQPCSTSSSGVPNTKIARKFQDYQNRQLITKEGNLSGPICAGHNQHTHTDNTRQPELNSRVPRVYPLSRAQLEGCHSEPHSRNATCLTPIPSSTQGILSELQLKEHQQADL